MKDIIDTHSRSRWLEDMLVELASFFVLSTFLTAVAFWAFVLTQQA